MNFYITTTTKCNLECSYCYGKSCLDFGSDFKGLKIDYSVPTRMSYDIHDLARFIRKDPSPTIIFYGGEPLIEVEKVEEIIDNIPAERYIIQTNGLLLDKLKPKYVKRLNTLLVSLDGDETVTDRNRGENVYRRVIENLKLIEGRGFKGELIARMTVTVGSEIDKQVMWLLTNRDFAFKSVHWQLDALFWQNDFDKEIFGDWSERVYMPGVRRLIETWIERIEAAGEVLRIYPLIAIMYSLLTDEKCKLRCGSGWNTFNIQTDGNITPCPVMSGMLDFYLGNIWDSNPLDISDSTFVGEPCSECEVQHVCGGRCLFANVTKLWGDEGFRMVCETVMDLINSLRKVEWRVRSAMREGKVEVGDFNYGRFNSCEIIP
ncbi:TIGR04084 family radical SAM/SPASM domain-containing protein [Candidatus Bathyarchaeota archaeon]|nr:TIGR04084 family radical SAM/SPASM domain-containing protein [Candidatus Bathyarchaeota archaeon]MBS7628686.1 TIGR04084 family radical SAM/SPASM domain-containing protein [Candidatus Bathyarchaeota archaeon]